MPFDDLGVSIEQVWRVTCHMKDCDASTERENMMDAQRAAIAHRRKHISDAIAAGEDVQRDYPARLDVDYPTERKS